MRSLLMDSFHFQYLKQIINPIFRRIENNSLSSWFNFIFFFSSVSPDFFIIFSVPILNTHLHIPDYAKIIMWRNIHLKRLWIKGVVGLSHHLRYYEHLSCRAAALSKSPWILYAPCICECFLFLFDDFLKWEEFTFPDVILKTIYFRDLPFEIP